MGLLSPDGRNMHFTWAVTGSPQVWRLDGPMRFPRQMTGGQETTLMLDYSPDGKFILVSRDANGEENPGLYWQPAEGGELRTIFRSKGVQAFYQWIAPDSRYVYYSANDVTPDQRTIYRYDMADGSRTAVFSRPGLWSVEDAEPGRLLLRRDLGAKWNEHYELDLAGGALTPLLGQGEKEDYQLAFGAARGTCLVLTHKYSDMRELRLLRDGRLEQAIAEPSRQLRYFRIDEARRRIIVQWIDRGYMKPAAYDAATFAPLDLPLPEGADNIHAGSVSRDGRYLTLGVDRHDAPQANYVWDWDKRELSRWTASSSPEIDTSGFAKAALEYYPARDGTMIPMFVRRPRPRGGPDPVIVYFHGGPASMSAPGFSAYAQLFVDAGFVWVAPNVRGSEGYGRKWLEADDGPRRLDVITDIEDCALHIRKAWARDGKAPKIGITGGSYGGYCTLMGMTRFAGAYDAGAATVGMSNLYTFLMNTAPYRRALRVDEYGDPEKDKEALLKLSPVTYAADIKGPLLIIQGANDPRVPAGEAVQMYEAARASGAELIIFPDEGHGVRKRANSVLSTGHILGFFERHLKEGK